MPETEASAEVSVVHHQLVADSWALPSWCVLLKWVPLVHGCVLKFPDEEEEDKYAECVEHEEELVAGCIHVRVDVVEEDHVDYGDEASTVLDADPCADEDQEEELEGCHLPKVLVVQKGWESRSEHDSSPNKLTRSLHDVEGDQNGDKGVY